MSVAFTTNTIKLHVVRATDVVIQFNCFTEADRDKRLEMKRKGQKDGYHTGYKGKTLRKSIYR